MNVLIHCIFENETPQCDIVDITKIRPKFREMIEEAIKNNDNDLILISSEVDPEDGYVAFYEDTIWNRSACVKLPCTVSDRIWVYEG